MTDDGVDLRAHLQGISIRLGHQLHAPGGRSATGTHHLCAELWALREVGWRGAAATLLHDARGQLRARINNMADRITTARRYDHGTLGKGRSLTRRRG